MIEGRGEGKEKEKEKEKEVRISTEVEDQLHEPAMNVFKLVVVCDPRERERDIMQCNGHSQGYLKRKAIDEKIKEAKEID